MEPLSFSSSLSTPEGRFGFCRKDDPERSSCVSVVCVDRWRKWQDAIEADKEEEGGCNSRLGRGGLGRQGKGLWIERPVKH